MGGLQITINGQKIDYTLEGEENLAEVLDGLARWLGREGYSLAAAEADGRALDLTEAAALQQIPIGEVRTLEVAVESELKREHENLAAIDEYLRLLRAGVEAEDASVIEKLMREYASLYGALDTVLDRNGIAEEAIGSAALERVVAGSGVREGAMPAGQQRDALFSYITAARSALAVRMREMESPTEQLAEAAEELRSAVEQLGEVSIMLQTGRDAEAMEAVVRFTSLSSRIVRLYPLLKQAGGVDFNEVMVDGVAFPAFYAEFNRMLGELIEAFGAEDSILIGDLLEYEIAPRLETLLQYIDLLTSP